ncbi:hypothetical protein [Thermoleophilum album]|uniref:DUF2238 domain-containing protein n=1 Tax=Thermoleophilum album TaxID=29539 RepID=A0A1H6G0S3_THEAL|nr:hypothetical protein [Thermoleophilum album]SEH16190.1 hypothetical protein SAMN02745716_2108 [Thermoleophilum album]
MAGTGLPTNSELSRGSQGLHRLRKALFGDWHPLLRDPLDLLRLSFAGAAVAFGLAGSFEYSVRLTGTFLLVLAAQRLRLPRLFDLLFIVGMWLQAWGNALRLFENIDWWDNLVHLFVPFSSVPVLYVLLVRLGLVHHEITDEGHPARHHVGLAIFAVAIGLSIGAIYEVYEYVASRWLNAPIEIGYSDTIFDLVLDTLGALAGGILLMLWAAGRRGTEREQLA